MSPITGTSTAATRAIERIPPMITAAITAASASPNSQPSQQKRGLAAGNHYELGEGLIGLKHIADAQTANDQRQRVESCQSPCRCPASPARK